MDISSASSVGTNLNADNNSALVRQLEKQKEAIEKQIEDLTADSDSDSDSSNKDTAVQTTRLQLLQNQLTLLEARIAQDTAKKNATDGAQSKEMSSGHQNSVFVDNDAAKVQTEGVNLTA